MVGEGFQYCFKKLSQLHRAVFILCPKKIIIPLTLFRLGGGDIVPPCHVFALNYAVQCSAVQQRAEQSRAEQNTINTINTITAETEYNQKFSFNSFKETQLLILVLVYQHSEEISRLTSQIYQTMGHMNRRDTRPIPEILASKHWLTKR